MKRLLQVGLDTLLISVLPILMWILLGFIVTKDISNVFTLTYPLQFFFAIFENVFGKGPNITAQKDKNFSVVDANIILGCIFVGLIVLLLAINTDSYITFFNMDSSIYHNFCLFSIVGLYFSFIIQLVVQKMYFENKNKTANKISLLFNLVNFGSIIILSLLFDSWIAISITLLLDASIIFGILIKNIKWTRFKIKFKDNLKYSSFSLMRNVSMFLTYIIGYQQSFSFGAIYLTTINFETLTTDTQWDILYAVDTVSKVDLSKGEFDYKKSLQNAYKLIGMLLTSTLIMNVCLYWYFKPNIAVLMILLLIQFIDMALEPIKVLRINYIQINESDKKHNLYYALIRLVRIACSFIPSAFCTYIGQVVSMICLLGYALFQCRNVEIFKLGGKRKCTN